VYIIGCWVCCMQQSLSTFRCWYVNQW